ncbi:Trem-like transcript 2 protein [Microtus ochrogaster]|uniref:Trem-like transcript 2 protein n=1 Tax=Microtus ochrogaster TaxID=79684 RepID=A0A8J6GWQ2_MICOH|nr:Trem-like transcript 2 protein [Microtus ochrogaster]
MAWEDTYLLSPILLVLLASGSCTEDTELLQTTEDKKVFVKCQYDPSQYANVKVLCQEISAGTCKLIVSSVSKNVQWPNFSIKDAPGSNFFTVAMTALTMGDSGLYFCGIIENDRTVAVLRRFHLVVSRAPFPTPELSHCTGTAGADPQQYQEVGTPESLPSEAWPAEHPYLLPCLLPYSLRRGPMAWENTYLLSPILLVLLASGCCAEDTELLQTVEGQTFYVKCRYDHSEHINVKVWCQQTSTERCKVLVSSLRTETRRRKFSIRDKSDSRFFTVTKTALTVKDSGLYFCGILKNERTVAVLRRFRLVVSREHPNLLPCLLPSSSRREPMASEATYLLSPILLVLLASGFCAEDAELFQSVEGQTFSVTCQYYHSQQVNEKVWCQQRSPASCKVLVSSLRTDTQWPKFSIRDHPDSCFFTVTMTALTVRDSGRYVCGIYDNHGTIAVLRTICLVVSRGIIYLLKAVMITPRTDWTCPEDQKISREKGRYLVEFLLACFLIGLGCQFQDVFLFLSRPCSGSPVSPGLSNKNVYRKVWWREGESLTVLTARLSEGQEEEARASFIWSWVKGPSYLMQDDAKAKVHITMEALRVQDSGGYWCMWNMAGNVYPLVGFWLKVYPGDPARAGMGGIV